MNADATLRYRPEIDGLRSVAVVPVVLFHAGFQVFSGGFVGVDVFFVISGYLITGILLGDIERHRYSIARFYERRARRILPALLAMMLACLPLAWAVMLPDEIAGFGRSVLAVLGFVSNIEFWREEGYFNTASELKPLLHTWSLAVEEQFYLAFPLLLWALRGVRPQITFAVLALAALASFGLCEYAAYHFQTANFYLSPSRAWELLAGSLCAFAGRHAGCRDGLRPSSALAASGLAMIVGSILLLDGTVPFPSHFALLPVGGAALVILFAQADRGVGRWLASAPLVGIGLISYSLYLWHQPLFVFARLANDAPPPQWVMLALSALAVGLASASWRFVEQPFRKRGAPGEARRSLVIAGAATAVLTTCAGVAVASQGWLGRAQNSDPAVMQFVAGASVKPPEIPGCPLDANGFAAPCKAVVPAFQRRTVALFGDSHAKSLEPAFAAAARAGNAGLVYGSNGGCPGLIGGYVVNGNVEPEVCARLAHDELATARREGVRLVYLASRWTLYTDGDPLHPGPRYLLATTPHPFRPNRADSRAALAQSLRRTVDAYRAAGIEVVLVGQVPQQGFLLDRTLRKMQFGGLPQGVLATVRATSTTVVAMDALRRNSAQIIAVEQRRGVPILDLDAMFRSNGRLLWGDETTTWYVDHSHLSLPGSLRLAPAVASDLALRLP